MENSTETPAAAPATTPAKVKKAAPKKAAKKNGNGKTKAAPKRRGRTPQFTLTSAQAESVLAAIASGKRLAAEVEARKAPSRNALFRAIVAQSSKAAFSKAMQQGQAARAADKKPAKKVAKKK